VLNSDSAAMHVLLNAELVTTSGRFPVTLREICARTALVSGHALPEGEARVVLERGPLRAFGHLTWSDGEHAEVRFEDELEDEALMHALRFVTPAHKIPVRCYRPGFHADLTPYERHVLNQMRERGELAVPGGDPC